MACWPRRFAASARHRAAACRAPARTRRPAARRTGRRPTRSSSSPTGPSTSTSPRTTSRCGRPWTRSSQQTGIEVTYQEDVNDNNEFFGKVRNQLSACQAIDRDIIVLTDWMAARMIRLGWVQPLAARTGCPNVEANLLAIAARPPVGQGHRVRRAVADRPRRHRVQRQRHQGGPHRRRAADPPGPQGQGHDALGDARHDGPDPAGDGPRPVELHRGAVRRGAEQAAGGGRLRPDPPLHRQRLRPGAREGRHRRVRRPGPAT